MKKIYLTLISFMLLIQFNVLVANNNNQPNYQAIINSAHQKFQDDHAGNNASYIPALASVNPNYFGIVLITTEGEAYSVGDTNISFAIESISKVFNMALALKENPPDIIAEKIGVNPTGMPFNSLIAIQLQPYHAQNPLVNAGAIATVSLLKGKNATNIWGKMIDNMNLFAGSQLTINQKIYDSEMETNMRNHAIAALLKSYGRLYSSRERSIALYTKGCSVNVTAKELAIMAATLANYGVNPITDNAVIQRAYVPKILTMMALEGLYNNSGEWLYETGVPAKSGVGGGLIAVVPGKFSIAAYSPKLDQYGNSVRGQKAIAYILEKLNANLFDSSGDEPGKPKAEAKR